MVTFIPWQWQTQGQAQGTDPSSSVLVKHSHCASSLPHNQLWKRHSRHLCIFKEPQAKDEQGMFKGCPYPRMPTPPLIPTFLYCGRFIGHCFYLLRHGQTCCFKILSARSAKSRTVASSYFSVFETLSLPSKFFSMSRKASSPPVCLLM